MQEIYIGYSLHNNEFELFARLDFTKIYILQRIELLSDTIALFFALQHLWDCEQLSKNLENEKC